MTGPADCLTVLTTVDGALATKRIGRTADGEWRVTPYGSARWFSVRQIEVDGLVSLGLALARLERDLDEHDRWLAGQPPNHASRSFIIRGEPLPGTNLARTRRLLYERVDEDGVVWPAAFEPRARRWLAIDFDDLPAPVPARRWLGQDFVGQLGVIIAGTDQVQPQLPHQFPPHFGTGRHRQLLRRCDAAGPLMP